MFKNLEKMFRNLVRKQKRPFDNSLVCIAHFPNELILLIFSFLEAKNLVALMLVNKHWNELANNDSLWDKLANSYKDKTQVARNKWTHETSKKFYSRLTGNIQLFGKTRSGLTATILVKPTDTIGTVRKAFAEKTNFDADYLDLKISKNPTKLLYNYMTLPQAGIGLEDTLHLFSSSYKRY